MARKLDNWLQAYMRYTSHSEAPDVFHFWTGISTIAGALRRKVYFDQHYYQWSPNFYILMIAPPGIATKSTSMAVGMDLLKEIPGVIFGPNTLTWQFLPKALSEARIDFPTGTDEYYPMCSLTFESSELGTLLDPTDRTMIDLLVHLWDGKVGAYEKATVGHGRDIVVNPWINIIAATTPAWIAQNLPRQMIGGGFVSRCVFVFGSRKRRLVAYPRDAMDTTFAPLRDALLHDLMEMAELVGEYELTPDAKEWGTTWYERHWERFSRIHGDAASGFASRMQCHAHKLAMVMTAAQTGKLLIQRRELEAATMLVEELERDLPTVFRAVDTTEEMSHVESVIEYAQKHGPIASSALFSVFMHMISIRAYEDAISAGQRSGRLVLEQKGNILFVRGPDGEQSTKEAS